MKTLAWQEYEQGADYKTRIGLYNTVDINERFYSGDQWVGIPHEGLPTPVINFIRYASGWKIAAVTDRRLKMQFFAEGQSDGGDIGVYARQISGYCDMLWERLKMDYLTKEGLKQAAITGDYIQYFYWDPDIKTGQALTGDINTSLIDNVSFYPGNPNSPDIQSQPYIILAFRELVSKVKDEAKKNGCENWEEITSDDDTEYTSGDRGKIELDNAGKCNVLLKMYKKDGKVYCEKSVRNAVIQPEKDSGLTLYPVALMNWETRKNCCHGTAEVTGLIPNQVFINKILALAQLGQVQTSFPKIIYDKTRIREWTNKVAGAVPVNGDIAGAAQYLSPPSSAYDAWKGLDTTLQVTMKMMGANEVTLGNIQNPDNTSAFIATRDAAMVPLQSQQERFYSFVEDVGHIWLDFITNFYRQGRMIPIMHGGQRVFVPIPEGALDKFTLNLRIDVGPSTMWSEVQVLQTLDNLLKGGKISFRQYLERIPEGQIPLKDDLLAETQKQESAAQGASQDGQETDSPAQEQAQPQIAAVRQAPKKIRNAAVRQAPTLKAQDGSAQQPGQEEDITGKIVKIVQVLAQAGKISSEVADEISKLGSQGAGAENIIQALQEAVQQGKIPVEAVQAIIKAAKGGVPQQEQAKQAEESVIPGQAQAQEAEQYGGIQSGEGQPEGTQGQEIPESAEQQNSGQDIVQNIVKVVQALAQAGKIPADIADAIMKLAGEGAGAEELLQALENAARQGKISEEALQAVMLAVKDGEAIRQTQQTGTAPQVQPVSPQQDAAKRIAGILQTLVQAGKVSADAAAPIIKMEEQGAGAEELLKALESAAQAGRIPEDIAGAITDAVRNPYSRDE